MLPRTQPGRSDRPDDTSVYLYFDRADTLIYVGITKRGIWRNREHDAYAEWWPFVARQTVEHCADRAAALLREKTLIKQFQPPFNKEHNPDHETLKAAYLSWHDRGLIDADPRDVMRAINKQLPLRVVSLGAEDRFALKAFPDQHPVTRRLVDVIGTPVQAGGRLGKIEDVRIQGTYAFFLVRKQRDYGPLDDIGFAPVKFVSLKSMTFRLTQVELRRSAWSGGNR